VRLLLCFAVLCQLLSAPICSASGSPADAPRPGSLNGGVSGHSVTTNRTDSGGSVTIEQTDQAVSVTIDGRGADGSASFEGADPRTANIIYLDNSNLPGALGRKEGVPSLTEGNLPTAGERTESANIGGIDRLLERAISQHLIEGGVAVVGNHSGILSSTARGRLNSAAGSPAISDRTIFDLASLTKVIATTPAVMKLLDEGRIALSDPLSRWIPEFANPGREEITILSLLTHTSGLDDVGVSSDQPMQSAIRKAAAQKHARAGSRFHYADINFILLGELVHRVSGAPLNAFCQEQIYGPLGTAETMFLPPRTLVGAIAPTSGASCGIVQDSNARRLGGVAGHAGLFSSAYDLSRFARMILGGGMLDDRRILSEQIVTRMTSPYLANNGAVTRGLGWDMQSPFSAPKGSYFSQASFGHTGYSGSSIWIDPQQDLFVILLTNRVNYRDTHTFNQLRRDVSTFAAADFKSLDGQGRAPATDLARINAELLQQITRVVKSSPRLRLASLGHKSQHQHQTRAQRRACKTDKAMAHGGRRATRSAEVHRVTRTAKNHATKASGSSKKRRVQARRA
jgi:CubicO group peptidase (beta-lactamase class C family)